jgi:hypothetical protein
MEKKNMIYIGVGVSVLILIIVLVVVLAKKSTGKWLVVNGRLSSQPAVQIPNTATNTVFGGWPNIATETDGENLCLNTPGCKAVYLAPSSANPNGGFYPPVAFLYSAKPFLNNDSSKVNAPSFSFDVKQPGQTIQLRN